MSGSKKVTVGYKYYLGQHLVLCHAYADSCTRVRFDKKVAWSGVATDNARINVDAPNLFGGKKREGGVSGAIDLLMGGPSQAQNDYLQAQLGTDIPAWRGVVSMVFRQFYFGMNYYLKAPDFRLQRIHRLTGGGTQWYDAKAAVGRGSDGSLPKLQPTVTLKWWQYSYLNGGLDQGEMGISFYDASRNIIGSTLWAGLQASPAAWTQRTLTANTPREAVFLRIHIHQWRNASTGWNYALIDDVEVLNGAEPLMVINPGAEIFDGTYAGLGWTTSLGGTTRNNSQPAHTGSCSWMGGNGTDAYAYQDLGTVAYDLNPAHLIRECITDTTWGKGKSASLCLDSVWQPVADTLYSEGLGISILWDQESSLQDFLAEILRHIDGVLRVNLTTGNYELKLIRNDYTVGSLPVLDLTNIDKIEDFQRPAVRDLVNSVTVNYWDAVTGEIASVSVQDIALVQLQGVKIDTTIEYPGITNSKNANRVALRDLRALATPRAHCTIYANRTAATLNRGDVFKLVWPDYGLSAGTVMRVATIAYGDGQRNQVRITCVEDVFALPTWGVSAIPDESWKSVSPPATESPTRLPIEAPYYELAQIMGDAEIQNALNLNANAAWFMLAARRSAGAINADLYTDAGGGYLEADTFDFSPNAVLAADVSITATAWTINSAEDWAEVQVGTHAQIDNEHVRIDAITATTLTVGRGCLDSVPAAHTAGARIWFWDAYSGNDSTEYVSGEVINAKVLPTTARDQLAIASAPVDSFTLFGRANKPYPPGKFKINGVAYPTATISGALALSWAHRSRIQQTTPTLYDTTFGDIGPEAGQTYTLRLYGQAGTLLRTETGLTGAAYTWSAEAADIRIPGTFNLDAFDTDSTASYTQLADSAGAWAVSGSELAATGGTEALFIRTGVSYTDCTIECDCNYAQDGGLALRVVDSANYYLLKLSDDSGATPTVNVRIWKRVAGTFTALGTSLNITWARGTSKNIQFQVVGSVLTASIDGAVVITVTDTALAGAGGVGMRNTGGGSNLSKYQAFRWTNAFALNGQVRCQLESVRSAITSWQRHDWTVNRVDPWWADVVALLRMDGTNGSTTFTDQKAHTFTATGNAQISTAQSQFGGAAALFDGTGDLVSSADHADWDLGSGDFTIECWVRPAAVGTELTVTTKRANNTDYSPVLLYIDAAGKAGFRISTSGAAWAVNILSAAAMFTAGTWKHVALCRQAGTVYCWVNGVSAGTASISGAVMVNTAALCIGANGDGSVSFNGNIDAFRITKARARYVAAFTPLNKAFPEG